MTNNTANKTSNSKSKWLKKGLIIFVIGISINTIFMALGIHGLVRELSRATGLVGLFMFIFGVIYYCVQYWQTQTGRSPTGKH